MASSSQPQYPFIDLVYQAVLEAMGNGNIEIRNFPALQSVAVVNFPAVQQVAGSLAVNNWPALQNVAIVNFPAIQTISGTVVLGATPSTTPVTFSPGYTTSASAPVCMSMA